MLRGRCPDESHLLVQAGLPAAFFVSADGRPNALKVALSQVRQTLPSGIARGLQMAVVGRDVVGLTRVRDRRTFMHVQERGSSRDRRGRRAERPDVLLHNGVCYATGVL
jgi:hypothetical protein